MQCAAMTYAPNFTLLTPSSFVFLHYHLAGMGQWVLSPHSLPYSNLSPCCLVYLGIFLCFCFLPIYHLSPFPEQRHQPGGYSVPISCFASFLGAPPPQSSLLVCCHLIPSFHCSPACSARISLIPLANFPQLEEFTFQGALHKENRHISRSMRRARRSEHGRCQDLLCLANQVP